MTIVITSSIMAAFGWGVFSTLYVIAFGWMIRAEEWGATVVLIPGILFHAAFFMMVFS